MAQILFLVLVDETGIFRYSIFGFFLYNSFICGVKSCVNFTGKKKQFLDLLFHLVFQIICPSDNDRKRKKEKKLRSKIYSNSLLMEQGIFAQTTTMKFAGLGSFFS